MGSVQNYVLQVTSRGDGESTKSLFDTDIHKAQTKIDPSRKSLCALGEHIANVAHKVSRIKCSHIV